MRKRSEHGELQRGLGLNGDIVALRAFVLMQHLTGSLNYGRRQAGQASDINSVTAIGSSFFYAMQKNDALGGLPDRDMQVFKAGELLGEQGELVVVGGEEGAGADVACRNSRVAQARERPSKVAVPRPISSRRRGSAV